MKENKRHRNKDTGFKVPASYFEQLEDSIFNELEDKKTIEGIEATGFKTPVDYFDSIENRVLKSIENDKVPVKSLVSRNFKYHWMASAAALVLALTVFLNRPNETVISAEMVETHLQSSDLDSYELAALLIETDFLEEDFDIVQSEFSEEHIETYLLEHADLENFID